MLSLAARDCIYNAGRVLAARGRGRYVLPLRVEWVGPTRPADQAAYSFCGPIRAGQIMRRGYVHLMLVLEYTRLAPRPLHGRLTRSRGKPMYGWLPVGYVQATSDRLASVTERWLAEGLANNQAGFAALAQDLRTALHAPAPVPGMQHDTCIFCGAPVTRPTDEPEVCAACRAAEDEASGWDADEYAFMDATDALCPDTLRELRDLDQAIEAQLHDASWSYELLGSARPSSGRTGRAGPRLRLS
jgi:hypothetical protein